MNHTRDRQENYYIAGWSVRGAQDESFFERNINQVMEYICKKAETQADGSLSAGGTERTAGIVIKKTGRMKHGKGIFLYFQRK